MIWTRAAARSPLLVGVPACFLLTLLMVRSKELVDGNYSPSFSGWALTGHVVAAPIAAACGCWLSHRFREAGWFERAWRRRIEFVLLRSAVVAALVLVATVYMAGVVAGLFQGFIAGPSWPQWAASLVMTTLCAVLGAGVARSLPYPVAMVISLVVPYVATVFPAAVEPLWIRHLTGYWPNCCPVYAQPDLRALLGVVLLASGVGTLLGLVLGPGGRGANRSRRVAGAALCLGPITAAFMVTSTLGVDPIQPRPFSDLRCAGQLEICLWPEHDGQRSLVKAGVRLASDRLAQLGLDGPRVVSELNGIRGAAVISVDRNDTPTTIAREIIRSRLYRDVASCGSVANSAAAARAALDQLIDSATMDELADAPPLETLDPADFDALVDAASVCN